MLFSQPCGVCFADVTDTYRHMAWHVLSGHDTSPEFQEQVKEAGRLAIEQVTQQYEAARAARSASAP